MVRLVLVCAVLACSAASAAVIDQSNDTGFSVDAASAIGASQEAAQTFTVGLDGQLTQLDVLVGLDIGGPSITDPLVVEVRTTSARAPAVADTSPPVFASVSIPSNQFVQGFSWVSVDLSGFDVPVSVGEVLAITMRTNSATPFAYNWWGTQANNYAGGATFGRTTGGSWDALGFIADESFRTYVQVPESATMSLLVLSAGAALLRRRIIGQ